jgi:hypothetical protein
MGDTSALVLFKDQETQVEQAMYQMEKNKVYAENGSD